MSTYRPSMLTAVWGQSRYTSGTLPTTYKFTGQREEASLGLYFYNARYYDPELGRFTQSDNVSPRIDAEAQDSESIRLALTVSFNDLEELKQLSNLYRGMLFEQSPTGSEKDTERRFPQLSLAMGSHGEAGAVKSDEQQIFEGQNLSKLGEVEYNQERKTTSGSQSSGRNSTKPMGINSQSHDRYSYTRNCPTRFNDPTGHTECDENQAWGGVAGIVLGGGIGLFGVGVAAIGAGELTVGAPTIIGVFIGLHEFALGILITGIGAGIMVKGAEAVIESGCIPGVESNTGTNSP